MSAAGVLDGQFVQPDDATFQAAAAGADWKGTPGFGVILTDQPGKSSWPVTGAEASESQNSTCGAIISGDSRRPVGSNTDGTLAVGLTCADWTSASADVAAQVGHSDGMGPGQSTAGALASWNSAHANQNCANTVPRGGAGRFYCFAR